MFIMKSVTLLLVLQAVLIQQAYSQCMRTCGTIATPVVAQPNVASTLADTLSLLTVSSLLAETLPFNPNIIATVPVPVAQTCSTPISPCGCGCGLNNLGVGYGCGGCGGCSGYGGCGGYGGYGINYIL